MTGTQGPAPAPGWYEDPSGQAALVRWWDGANWTSNTAPRPSGQFPIAPGRPVLGPETPVYTPYIWLVVLLPLLSIPNLFLTLPDFGAITRDTTAPGAAVAAIYTPGYFLGLGISLVIYGLMVLFAALDHRTLVARGVARPFAWPWAFLSAIIYVIGRSVIVHQVARPRGLVPIWVQIGVMAVSFIVSMVLVVSIFSQILQQVPYVPVTG